jgi:hypothetical protein
MADLLAFYTRRWMHSNMEAGVKVPKPKMLEVIGERANILSLTIADFAKLKDPENDRLPSSDWYRMIYPPK